MAASFPDSVKNFTDLVDGVDEMEAANVNDAYAEIEAIEGELAAELPRGGYANTETLTDALVLVDTDPALQYLDPGGSARDVTLPAEGDANHLFVIVNTADAAETLTVKDDGGNTIGTVAQGEVKIFVSNSAAWKVASTGSGGSSLTKASGSDIITGTDDEKYVTAKALKDAGNVPVKLIGGVPHKQLWIGGAKPTLTAGCAAPAQIEMATYKRVFDYLAFDKDTTEYAYAVAPMPQDYTGGNVYAQFYWLHPATTTNFGVVWQLGAIAFSNDDALDATISAHVTVTDTGGTTSDLYISPVTDAYTILGTPVAGDLIWWQLSRVADNGSDNLAVDAYLLGVIVWYPVA